MNTSLIARVPMRGVVIAGIVALAACGGSDPAPIAAPAATSDPTPTTAPATAPAPPTTDAPAAAPAPVRDAAVKISQTDLGDVLADPEGKTLYAFTNDVEAQSTCYGTCAEAWPPVIVQPDFIVSPGLDTGIFATTVREDGSHQLVAGKFPLYLFAADAKPGDITGHGSGDVWFAVDLGGRIIGADGSTAVGADDTSDDAETDPGYGGAEAPTAAASLVRLGDSELGPIVTDADGLSLYLFTPDEDGNPTCVGDCAGTWPPYLVDPESDLTAEGIDPALLSTVEHPDGGTQLKIGPWPLYYFAADQAPGDIIGQGSGDKWFVVAADATSVR